MKRFLNGVEDKSAKKFGSSPMPPMICKVFYLGRPVGGTEINFFAGHVRKMSIWNRELLEEDVENLYSLQEAGSAEPRPSYPIEMKLLGY